MRVWPAVALSFVLAGCDRSPSMPSPDILLSNLKSDVLASSTSGCAREPGLTLTYFTFDFEVRGGVDLASGASVYRVRSGAAPADAEVLGAIEYCATGPCAPGRRACITAGRSNASGTIELFATEAYRPESTWTIQIRQGGPSGTASNALTTTVSYPPN